MIKDVYRSQPLSRASEVVQKRACGEVSARDSGRFVGNAEVIRSPSTLRPAVQKRVRWTWMKFWIGDQPRASCLARGCPKCFSQNRGHMKSRSEGNSNAMAKQVGACRHALGLASPSHRCWHRVSTGMALRGTSFVLNC